jgi:hypothetical protein
VSERSRRDKNSVSKGWRRKEEVRACVSGRSRQGQKQHEQKVEEKGGGAGVCEWEEAMVKGLATLFEPPPSALTSPGACKMSIGGGPPQPGRRLRV